jgi:hypothetical protein
MMQSEQPYNIAIAEVEYNGQIAKITGKAATIHDDAIKFIVNMLNEQGISGDKVLNLYSEHEPSTEWYDYFKQNWPNVNVTWSFAANEDKKFEKAVDNLISKKRWWKFW